MCLMGQYWVQDTLVDTEECVYKHSIRGFLEQTPKGLKKGLKKDCPTPADVSDFCLAVVVLDLYTDKAGLCQSLKDLGMMPFKYRI